MIKGMNHVGISVSNLDRSIEFYQKGLGMELTVKSTFEPGKYDGMYEAILALRGATGRVAMVKLGNIQLELFEFAQPTPKRSDPNRPVCDHGITHFCVEVTDIDIWYERLKAMGTPFHCPPQKIAGKAAATYARDPDGNVFELLQLYKQPDAPQ